MLYKGGTIGANGKEYRFEIVTNNDTTAEQELTLVAHGLIVRVDGGELFAPLRGGSASITVQTDEIYPDIYASGAMDVPVTIYEDDSIFFAGYVTPCMYSQELPSHKIQLTIECVDCLSVLQNVPYCGELAAISINQYFHDAVDVINNRIQLNVIEPYTLLLAQMYVQSSNWYDEEGEPSKWSEVLSAICQWLGVRLTQWRGEWLVSPIRVISAPIDVDSIVCNAGAQMSLSEVYNKAKVEVSLYNGATVIDKIFDSAKLVGTGEYSGVELKGAPSKYYSYVSFFTHPQIKRYSHTPYQENVEAVDSIDAMNSSRGAWLVGQYSRGLVGAKIDGADSVEYYLVLCGHTIPSSDRGTVFPEELNEVMATISDTSERIYERDHVITINGQVLLSEIPAPLLCPELDGGHYNPYTGKYEEDKKIKYPASIRLRISCGDFQLGIDGGVMGWFHDKNSASYQDWISMPLWLKANQGNVLNKLIDIPGESYKYHGEFNGFIIPMADGVEGRLKIDIIGGFDVEGSFIDSMWIKDLEIDVRRQVYGGAREWFDREVRSNEDVVYETVSTSTSVNEMKEIVLKVSTDVGIEYSRSMVYKDSSDLYPPYNFKKPLGELNSTSTGETAIAEHHLLNEMVRQYSTPRTILQGTWRNHVGNPLQPYISTSMRKTFLCEAIEVDCHGSRSTMTLEEVL